MKLIGVVLLCACSLWAGGRWERFALVLEDEPLATDLVLTKGLPTAAMAQRRLALESKQANLQVMVESLRYRPLGSAQMLVNAVFVAAPAEAVDELRKLPGVIRVQTMQPLRRRDEAALALTNVPGAWASLGGA